MTLLLAAFFVSLYVRPQDWMPGLQGLPTTWILVPLGLGLGIASHRALRTAMRTPHVRLMAGYLMVIFVSTLVNTDVGTAFGQFLLFFQRGLVLGFMLLVVSTEGRMTSALRLMLAMSMFLAFQAWLQYSTGESWGGLTRFPGYVETRVRWYGDWDGPNVLGLLFTLSAAMTLDSVFSGASIPGRVLGAVGFIASFAGIFFTNSRGAFLGVLAAIAFYLRTRLRPWMAIPVGGLALAALVALGPSRITTISSSESSAGERVWLWEQGLTLLQENPLLGVGRGQFIRRNDLGLIAHNNFVQNFTETGLLGFFCFVALLWFSFRAAYIVQQPSNGYSPGLQAAGRRLASMLVAYCATTFFVVMENDLLYVLFGLGAALAVLGVRQQPDRKLMAIGRRDLLVIGGAMVAIIAAVWLAAVKEIV